MTILAEMAVAATTTILPNVLSSFCYDLLKSGTKITLTALKKRFPILSENEELSEELSDKLKALTGEIESIKTQIETNQEILSLLERINNCAQININQNHYGTGDNIARDKIINYSK